MAAVKQQVLNWLYSVLTSEYKAVSRTYEDVAQTLSYYSSLSPRTDVYTYENGASALLLHISGTLPVVFRGTPYRFPIEIWVPHGYPREAPLAYVTPTEGMMVRPGQHVDPQGKIYHPYLAGWAEYWDKSNILDFLVILREVFAKEPPVISRQHIINPPQSQAPPPVPPLPPGMARSIPQASNKDELSEPPPPPPKPTNNAQQPLAVGPALPSLRGQSGLVNNRCNQQLPRHSNDQLHLQRNQSLRYEPSPRLPFQSNRQQESSYDPVPPPSQQNQQVWLTPDSEYEPQQNRPPSYTKQQPYSAQPSKWQQNPPQTQIQSQAQPKPLPLPDLLDAQLVLSIPSAESTNLPAPPIPPNPEKDMLLHNISRALCSQRQHTRMQTIASLPGLKAQHKAMLNSLSNMQAEIKALESLNDLLDNNTNILHSALRDADALIKSSQHRSAPGVDELLMAPTVVANQLYELVSEERSLGDVLFILGRAVERGRISPAVFAKMTRTLAREWYLKKALARKIGLGMGLITH